jgi:hypothetical protein
MEKISVSALLAQYGLTWHGLYRRGGGTKSMCWSWVVGKHLPSTKSAVRIARALGLPSNYVLDILHTRNSWENSPRVPWGFHVRQALESASTNADIKGWSESDGPWCITCRQRLPKPTLALEKRPEVLN